jgi:lipid-binding SYLF domain-containing protein
MKAKFKLLFVSALILTGGTLFAASIADAGNDPMYYGEDVKIVEKANETLQNSVMALDNIMNDPENSIPTSLISQSEGIVIFPRALKIALGTVGGQGARGIAMIRQEDGSWSNPFFVSLGEASVGIQIGVQKSDLVLLFKNKNDVIAIDEADIMLGTGVGVAAGPVSREASSNTDISFDAEIYSYQKSKGLFAGVNLNGGVLSSNDTFNETIYCMGNADTNDIFMEIEAPFNDQVEVLIETIEMYSE